MPPTAARGDAAERGAAERGAAEGGEAPRSSPALARGAGVAADAPAAPGTIEMRLGDIAQLFHPLDPAPAGQRRLSPEVDEYILAAARDLPPDRPVRIVLHLSPDGAVQPGDAEAAGQAVRDHFAARARGAATELRAMFRIGRKMLYIALMILSASLFMAFLVSDALTERPLTRILRESFVIIAWVATWKPAELLLYEWRPLARRRDLYGRLAHATVELHAGRI